MSKPLHLLLLVTRDEQGGVQILTRMIASGLAGEDIVVTTLALADGPFAILRHILFRRPDAVFTFHAAASVIGCTLAAMSGISLRAAHQTAMPHAVRPHWRLLDRLCGRLGLYSHVVANSTATGWSFLSYPKPYRNRLVLIPHGVEPLPSAGGDNWRQRLAIPADAPFLLATGRLAPQKNHAIAIAALVHLPHAHLAIAGDGPDRALLLQLALDAGVAGRLHLPGGLDRVALGALMAEADIYLFPSVWETFGLAGVEAGMAGLPIVAADLPVLREVLAPGSDLDMVRFHPATDAAALARAARALLTQAASTARRARSAHAFLTQMGTAPMLARYRALLGMAAPASLPRSKRFQRTASPAATASINASAMPQPTPPPGQTISPAPASPAIAAVAPARKALSLSMGIARGAATTKTASPTAWVAANASAAPRKPKGGMRRKESTPAMASMTSADTSSSRGEPEK